MNKLRELANRATQYCIDMEVNSAWVWEEKFAELIVKECAEAAREIQDFNDVSKAQLDSRKEILTKFGVI